MTACVSIPTFRRPKSRQKGSAHGTGQSVSPFVQELPSAISFSRLNLVTNNFSSFARGETVRPPLEMSDTKSFTFFLAKDGYWLCPLRCRMFLMLPMLQYPIAKVTFKELQHCQNHRQRPQRGAEKMYKFSDAHSRGQTCTSRDYQGEVAGKEQPTEGYFRFRKFASKGCDD